MQQIKDDAIHKIEVDNAIHGANDKVYHGNNKPILGFCQVC
jgi:hypothetical protein